MTKDKIKVNVITVKVEGEMQFVTNTDKADSSSIKYMLENPMSSGLEFSKVDNFKIIKVEEKDASEVFPE